MKHFLLVAGALVWTLFCSAQQQFQEYIYDSTNPIVGWHMNITADSGFIVNGKINTVGSFLLKMDKTGNTQWFNNYSGVSNIYDVEQTSDGGYIAIGDNGANKAVILKTDTAGNVQWIKVRSSNSFPGGTIHELPSGGYIFGGGFGFFLCRMDASGNVMWEKFYGISIDSYNSTFMQLTSDGGVIACGTLASAGGIALVKIDSLGNIQWQKAISPGGQHGGSVRVTPGGYFLTGYGANEHTAILTDADGTVLWAKQWPMLFSVNLSEPPFEVVAEGNQLICFGTRYLTQQTTATLIFKFDVSGNVVWSNYFGSSLTDNMSGMGSCRLTPQNTLAFTMHVNGGNGIFLVQTDSTMNVNCNGSVANFSPTNFAITYGSPAITVQTPSVTYSSPACTATALTATITYACGPLSTNDFVTNEQIGLYPNPANEKITLQFPSTINSGTISILDISGRMVSSIPLDGNSDKIEINTTGFAPGLYLWNYVENGNVVTGKFCIQH